jgi:hypothetical protein
MGGSVSFPQSRCGRDACVFDPFGLRFDPIGSDRAVDPRFEGELLSGIYLSICAVRWARGRPRELGDGLCDKLPLRGGFEAYRVTEWSVAPCTRAPCSRRQLKSLRAPRVALCASASHWTATSWCRISRRSSGPRDPRGSVRVWGLARRAITQTIVVGDPAHPAGTIDIKLITHDRRLRVFTAGRADNFCILSILSKGSRKPSSISTLLAGRYGLSCCVSIKKVSAYSSR